MTVDIYKKKPCIKIANQNHKISTIFNNEPLKVNVNPNKIRKDIKSSVYIAHDNNTYFNRKNNIKAYNNDIMKTDDLIYINKKQEINNSELRGLRCKTMSTSTCDNSKQKKNDKENILAFSVNKPIQNESHNDKNNSKRINKSFYTSESNIFKLSKNVKNSTFSDKKSKNDNDKITSNSAIILNETISFNKKNDKSHLPLKKFTHMKDQFSNRSFYQ